MIEIRNYKSISIPLSLWNRIEKIKTEHPEYFMWRSSSEFIFYAVMKELERMEEKYPFLKRL